MKYSKSTGGFYLDEIHGENIPSDAVEITNDEHAALLAGQSSGQIISSDANGAPVLVDAPPRPNPRIAAITAELTALDLRKIRPIATGDAVFLATLNAQSDTLREELKGLTA